MTQTNPDEPLVTGITVSPHLPTDPLPGVEETEIAEYRPIAAALHDLYTRHAGVLHDCTTTQGMQACREARAEIRTCRTSLEAKRREIKAPALERCRLIDADAKRITEALLAIEDPLDAQVKAEERAAEARREAKRKADMERVARLRRIVEGIRAWPLDAVEANAQELRDLIDGRYAMVFLDLPEEIRQEATEAKDEALRKLGEMLAARVAREAEDARLAAERRAELERQAAERERWAREQAAEQRQREEADERIAAERAELDRQRVEHARIERELADERARIAAERARDEAPMSDFPPSNEDEEKDMETEPGTTLMRVRFEKRGGHYHCRVFTAPRPGVTFAKNGDLVFDEAEWPDVPLLMRGAEFVEEASGWP